MTDSYTLELRASLARLRAMPTALKELAREMRGTFVPAVIQNHLLQRLVELELGDPCWNAADIERYYGKHSPEPLLGAVYPLQPLGDAVCTRLVDAFAGRRLCGCAALRMPPPLRYETRGRQMRITSASASAAGLGESLAPFGE